MKLNIVSIYDRKLEAFGAPATVTALGGAIRGFQDAIQDKDTQFSKHPEDYELFHIATWDDATARFNNLEQPKSIAIGANYVQE